MARSDSSGAIRPPAGRPAQQAGGQRHQRHEQPSTAGMKADGYYDLHSEYQRRVIEQGADMIRKAVAGVEIRAETSALTIADYGAGTGATSVMATRTAVSALRERDAEVPIRTVHNDVLTNDFTQLFSNVAGPQGYLDVAGSPIYPTAVGGSFFDQVVPSATVQIGMCSNAAHWCRQQRQVAVPEGMYFSDARDASWNQLAALAAADWNDFLSARAAELAPGGRLLQQGIGRVGSPADEHVSGAKLLTAMSSVAVSMVNDGMLDPAVLERYTFPVFCRSEEEILEPVSPGGALADQFDVVEIRVDEVANPYWEKFERDNDLDAYAEAYLEFIRAWADSTMMANLFATGALDGSPQQVAKQFFDRLARVIREDPAASRYDVWVIRVLMARRSVRPPVRG